MNLKLSKVELYARGSAPLASIPLLGIGVIVFRRRHLQAALSTEPSRIIYNADTKTVTFRTARSEWKLNDLLGQQKIHQWQIREQLTSWARGKGSGAQTRKATGALGKHGVYVRKLNEAIAKLAKQRDKISLQRQQHPLLHDRWAEAGEYGRNEAKRWADEKPIRKALAEIAGRKLIHGEPKTWADFYRAVETASGRPVTVDTARLRPLAIPRIDPPDAIPREISSRSASVSIRGERRRTAGAIPPCCANIN